MLHNHRLSSILYRGRVDTVLFFRSFTLSTFARSLETIFDFDLALEDLISFSHKFERKTKKKEKKLKSQSTVPGRCFVLRDSKRTPTKRRHHHFKTAIQKIQYK